jgi:ATP-binding cassette subfamily A (ABC1) protein 3
MLTGDIPISKGRAFINGFSVVKQMGDVRKEIGYCPQFDPLLELMTSREQLTMYARIHGIAPERIDALVERTMATLGLAKFADKICGPYSGGNKRKLSLALALIGDPAVLFLDEPSTGMDPVSRRFMWSAIESVSEGRSVVLTTHSMEECEALASRVGIMVAGALQCLGSVQHLKSKLGDGYHLEINADESSVAKVRHFIKKAYPASELDEVHAGRLKFRLPQKGLTLSSVFSSLEAHKKGLQIFNYSISQCSLESIFLASVSAAKKKENESV